MIYRIQLRRLHRTNKSFYLHWLLALPKESTASIDKIFSRSIEAKTKISYIGPLK